MKDIVSIKRYVETEIREEVKMMPEITEMTPDDYRFLYGKLHKDQIPDEIYEKIMYGEELGPDEEKRIKAIIKSSQDV